MGESNSWVYCSFTGPPDLFFKLKPGDTVTVLSATLNRVSRDGVELDDCKFEIWKTTPKPGRTQLEEFSPIKKDAK
jgi:hypothetical protein